jgi:hypothetical protein
MVITPHCEEVFVRRSNPSPIVDEIASDNKQERPRNDIQL